VDSAIRELAISALFALFFCGALAQIVYMLVQKRRGEVVSGHRLIFFFMACLSLVCLVPLWLIGRLTASIWVSDLSVVLVNLMGWALTFGGKAPTPNPKEAANKGVRAYAIYHQGQPLGVVTKEGFARLAELKLLRKQQTVELIDNYVEEARKQGVRVVLLQNTERSQTLIKVEELSPT
jgi:hypothetical protein